MRKSEIEAWAGVSDVELYAVYRVPSTAYSDVFFPAGEYGVAFYAPPDDSLVIFQVGDSGIVRVDYRYGFSLEEALGVQQEDIILGPIPPAK